MSGKKFDPEDIKIEIDGEEVTSALSGEIDTRVYAVKDDTSPTKIFCPECNGKGEIERRCEAYEWDGGSCEAYTWMSNCEYCAGQGYFRTDKCPCCGLGKLVVGESVDDLNCEQCNATVTKEGINP